MFIEGLSVLKEVFDMKILKSSLTYPFLCQTVDYCILVLKIYGFYSFVWKKGRQFVNFGLKNEIPLLYCIIVNLTLIPKIYDSI